MSDDEKRDIARQKASELGRKYGGLAGQRASAEFQLSVLAWVLRFKFTTPEVLGELLGVRSTTVRDKLRKLVLKKLIKKVACHTVKSNYIYMITPLGASTLKDSMGNMGVPTFNSLRVANKAHNVHDLCVQLFCARIYRTRDSGDVRRMFSTSYFKQIKKLPALSFKTTFDGKTDKKSCIPDAAVEFDDGSCVAVEYDSQSKNAGQVALRLIYHALYMERDDAFYQKVLFVFRYESSVVKYRTILDKWLDWYIEPDEYYEDYEDEKNDIISCNNEPHRQSIRDKFKWHHMPDVSVFYGGRDLSIVSV